MTRGTRPARATAAIPAQAGGHGHPGSDRRYAPRRGGRRRVSWRAPVRSEPGHDGTAPPQGSTASAMTNQPAVPNRLQRPRAARWSHPQRPPITAGRSMGTSRCGSRDRLDSRGSSRNASTRRRLADLPPASRTNIRPGRRAAEGHAAHRGRPERFFFWRRGAGAGPLARRCWPAGREPALLWRRPEPVGSFVVESLLVRGLRPEGGGSARFSPRSDLKRSPCLPCRPAAACASCAAWRR